MWRKKLLLTHDDPAPVLKGKSRVDSRCTLVWWVVGLVVVELQAHAVVDLVVLQRDVVLVDGIPLLDPQLLGARADLRGQQLLQVADGVVLAARHGQKGTVSGRDTRLLIDRPATGATRKPSGSVVGEQELLSLHDVLRAFGGARCLHTLPSCAPLGRRQAGEGREHALALDADLLPEPVVADNLDHAGQPATVAPGGRWRAVEAARSTGCQ